MGAVEEICRLYHREMRTCDALVIPQSDQSAYCTDHNERDGGWSSWSPFGSCTSTNGNCRRTRTRDCDSPSKSAKGLPCPGSYEEFEDCAQDACPVSFVVTVERNATTYGIPAGTIYFDYLMLDHGDNFHMPSGTFRTPMDGLYLFMLDGRCNSKGVDLTIKVNGIDRRKILDVDTPVAEVNGIAALRLEAYDLVNVKVQTSWAPPRVSRERLDRVPESPESESNYDDVEEEACQEPSTRIPCNSSSMDSFDSGLDTRSETGPEFASSASSSVQSPASLSSPPSYEGQEAQGRAEELLQTRAEDAVKIYRRYIAPECQRPVHLDTEIKRRIVESICTEQGHVAADCFDEAQHVVVEMLETEYFPDFLTSQFHAKHQVDVLTSGQVMLADILYNDTALFHFMEFLEGHGQRVVMEFWLAAVNFSQANSRGATECQNDAMVLYDKFLSMQAPSPLGLPSNVRLQVEDAICRPGGPDSTCFQPVLSLVAAYLEANHFKPFLASALYNNYVKELIAMIQASPRSLSSVQASLSTTRTESDTRSSCSSSCSSDRLPRSTSNALLAASSGLKTSSSFDCGELQDPDSIWRRRPVKNKVGRVNSYGRYQPGLDLAPEMSRTEGTKKTSRLGRVVKNLVNNEEKEKMKEELAWQVAEMIVRDVTSVTMPEKEGGERRSSINGEELKNFREGGTL